MTEEEIRKLINLVITERTMPRKFYVPNEDWLVPWYRIVEDNLAMERQINELRGEITALKIRFMMIEAK